MKKLTTAEFIEKAKKVHGDKYDYSLVEYVAVIKKIKIRCKHHGIFEQTPNSHLGKCGCPKCGSTLLSNSKDFIKKSLKIHGDKYDYSLVNYTTAKIKVKNICKEHGIFEQVPNSHLNGNGCLKCYNINRSKLQILGTSKFIRRSNEIHNFKYDYSKVEYKGCKLKVNMICPIMVYLANHLITIPVELVVHHVQKPMVVDLSKNTYISFMMKSII